MRNLTPTKQPVADVTEKEEDNKETATEDVPTEVINKVQTIVTARKIQLAHHLNEKKTPAKPGKSSGIEKYFSPPPAKSLFAQRLEKAEISLLSESLDSELMSTLEGTDKRNASQLSHDSPASTAKPTEI
jgi:hypothetical protein